MSVSYLLKEKLIAGHCWMQKRPLIIQPEPVPLRHRQFQSDGDGNHGAASAGASFVHPDTPLRTALTDAAACQVVRFTENSGNYLPVGQLVDEKSSLTA